MSDPQPCCHAEDSYTPSLPSSQFSSSSDCLTTIDDIHSAESEWEKDFPSKYYLDKAEVSPISRRWQGMGIDPQKHYMDDSGVPQPYPRSPVKQAAAEIATQRLTGTQEPPIILKELITTTPSSSQLNHPSSLPSSLQHKTANPHNQLTIFQRRQLRRQAGEIKKLSSIIIPNYNTPHITTTIEREYDTIFEETKPTNMADDKHQHPQNEPSAPANDKHTSSAPTSMNTTKYLAGIIAAGRRAIHRTREGRKLWPVHLYRGFERDGDYDTWVDRLPYCAPTAEEYTDYDSDDYEYDPATDEPKIGDPGIPDQNALDEVIDMRDTFLRFNRAIKQKKAELGPKGYVEYFCRPLTPPPTKNTKSTTSPPTASSTVDTNHDDVISESPTTSTGSRPSRIKVLNKEKYIQAARQEESQAPTPEATRNTDLSSDSLSDSDEATPTTRILAPLRRGRTRTRTRGHGGSFRRGRPKRRSDNAAFKPDASDDTSEDDMVSARKKRKTKHTEI